MRILNSCVVWQDSILQTGMWRFAPASAAAHFARLLLFDKTSAQPDFSVVNCSDAVMGVFYSLVLTRSLIFLQLRTDVS